MPTTKQLIDSFARAIAHQEGFFDARRKLGPTIPQRLHNPLDLPSWKRLSGESYPEVNGYVEFPSCERPNCKHPDHPAESGWACGRMRVWIGVVKRELTFLEFFAGKPGQGGGFAPEKSNGNPREYAEAVLERVARDLGLAPAPEGPSIHTRVLSLASDGDAPALSLKPPLPLEDLVARGSRYSTGGRSW